MQLASNYTGIEKEFNNILMEKIHFKALEIFKEDMRKASFFDEFPNEISLKQAYKEMGWK